MLSRQNARDRTISDFGNQWLRHTDNSGRYGSLAQFEDIVAPFLTRQDIAHMSCADIGSGTGRIVRMLLAAGARHVTGIEPSDAYDVLVRNCADAAERTTLLRLRGDQLPPADFDVVVSIGVIHHIPEPEPVLAAACAALKPKGVLLIWVYGHEGARVYKSIFLPVRIVTKRLPIWLNECLAWMLYPIALSYGWLTTLFPWLPLREYYRDVWLRFTPDVRRLVILDQINPRWAKYYRQAEIERLVREAGFEQVRSHHRHGYSWTVVGVKPG